MSNYQVLNDESRKYFQQLLLMSGTAIDFNAISNIDHVDEMYAFAKSISQPADNITHLIEILQNAQAQPLLEYTSRMDLKKLVMRDWAPIIERKYSNMKHIMFLFITYSVICIESIPFLWNNLIHKTNQIEFLLYYSFRSGCSLPNCS